MSYNIIAWKTRKIDSLKLPLSSLYEHERKDYHPAQPKIKDISTMEVEINLFGSSYIKGYLNDQILTVSDIYVCDEGSGTVFERVLTPVLKQSTGVLKALVTWEEGDVFKLKVKNGKITEKEL